MGVVGFSLSKARSRVCLLSKAVLPIAAAMALHGCAGGGDSAGILASVKPATQAMAVTAVRSLRMFRAFTFTTLGAIFAGSSSDLQYDGNLYFSSQTQGTTVTVNFFKDQAGTQPAGTIVANL